MNTLFNVPKETNEMHSIAFNELHDHQIFNHKKEQFSLNTLVGTPFPGPVFSCLTF